MIETEALWDHEAMVKRQAMLPPWSPESRERVRRDLRAHPMCEVEFHPYTLSNGEAGRVARVVDPQPTVLREERKARADNIAHYCRKCRGLGTKRHHAMCQKRGFCHTETGRERRDFNAMIARDAKREPCANCGLPIIMDHDAHHSGRCMIGR